MSERIMKEQPSKSTQEEVEPPKHVTYKNEVEEPNESTIQEEVYDPHIHRDTYKPVSDFGSFANLVKSAAGTGLFAMPNAFACVGLAIGIIGTAFMGLLITVSLQLLVRIHHMMCIRLRKPILVYDEVVVATLTTDVRKPWLSTRAATLIVDITMLACYIGIGSVYVVFISGIIQECIDSEKVIGQSYYALMIFPLLFAMNMMKNLADIAPISIMGNILLLAAGLIGVVYALKDGIGDTWATIGPKIDLYPKFIGVVFFSMCSPGVILAIEHSMKKPWDYIRMCGILNWGMAFLIIIHIFVGSIGYLKWGPDALGNFIRNHEIHDGSCANADDRILACKTVRERERERAGKRGRMTDRFILLRDEGRRRKRKTTGEDRIRARACASGVFNACYPAEPQSAFAADAGAVRSLPVGGFR